LFIAALMPPPIPMVPFVLAAGALEYPCRKFIVALTSARALRYFVVALLASIYGRQLIGWARPYYKPILWTFVGLVVLGALAGLIWLWRRKKQSQEHEIPARHDAAA
jgi:membrane protein DedA with SNARE-associated domain